MNRGGKRRGAGRKPKGERALVSHDRRPKLSRHDPVLVTLRLAAGLRSLRAEDEHMLVLRALSAASAREDCRVIEYSVQSNHLHLVVEARDERALSRGMTGLVVRLAPGLNKLWRRRGQVFPDRFHARALTTPREVRNALVYVLMNGRKHDAWHAPRPDPYSSGPSFEGWHNVAESKPRLLPRPRTWLLAVGWRRHGLIAVTERPAVAA